MNGNSKIAMVDFYADFTDEINNPGSYGLSDVNSPVCTEPVGPRGNFPCLSTTLNSLNPLNPVGGSTGMKVDSKLALSPGLGMSIQMNDRWFVDFSYAKTFLKTTTTLSTGQTIQTTLDPGIATFGVGMKF